ncbi:MAG TPA: hypothetical protein VK171_16065, partial [Fimbriimonas sp.]|nr:hypothetical protein [Fimbriimonas sp.]
MNVERNSDPAAYTGTYHVGAVIPATVNRFEVEFFAQTGQAGSIVATANADVTWQGTQASFGEVLTEGKVASVTVVDPGDVS